MEAVELKDHIALEKLVQVLEKRILTLESVPADPEWFTVEQVRELIGGRNNGKICRQKISELIQAGLLVKKHDSLGIRISSRSVRQYNINHTIK